MKNLFLISFIILIIAINTQPKNQNAKQPKKPEVKNAQQNPKKVNAPNQKPNNTNTNNTNINANNTIENKNTTKKYKEFNLTESLIRFFDEMFGTGNDTKKKTEQELLEEKKKEEQKRLEEETKRKMLEQINIAKEKEEKRKREKKLQLEKEREEFEKKIENISISDFTNLNLESKSGELLYHNTTKPCHLKLIFMLTDTEKDIHLVFNGPNGKGGTSLIQSFRHKNFLYYEYDAKYVGQYTFYLNNYHNPDETEIIFAVADDSKKNEDNLGKKNIDKISGYLNDIDSKIQSMSLKQNLVNRKTDKHNESVNKHNKKIFIYSIIEVITMIVVFILQTCYIKRIVEKI